MMIVISVISGEMESIITSTPTRVQTEVISCVMDWFRDWPSVSTSLVMRLSTSPTVLDSKYASGMRLIFLLMSSRIW